MNNIELIVIKTTDGHTLQEITPFPAGKYIREIGRGANSSRSLTKQDAFEVFSAMLAGRVSDLELGALLLSWRFKAESVAELAGMLEAAHLNCCALNINSDGDYLPVIIPSYNGARKQANLVPLLAMLLAREGVPVLVHGISTFSERVTSAMLFKALDLPIANDMAQAEQQLAHQCLSFVPIEILSPTIAGLLDKRKTLHLRNSAHTIVKMLQPIGNHSEQEAVRLVNFTHPEYLLTLTEYFSQYPANVLIARGTEGEAVMDARRMVNVLHMINGQQNLVIEAQKGSIVLPADLPNGLDIEATQHYILDVYNGRREIPQPIAEQLKVIKNIARKQLISRI